MAFEVTALYDQGTLDPTIFWDRPAVAEGTFSEDEGLVFVGSEPATVTSWSTTQVVFTPVKGANADGSLDVHFDNVSGGMFIDFRAADLGGFAPWTRDSSATCWGHDGLLLTNIPAGVPRFPGARWDGSAWHDEGVTEGLLFEREAKNYMAQSNLSDWTQNNGIVATQNQTGTDGSANGAWLLEDNSTSGSPAYLGWPGRSDSTTNYFVYSVRVKKAAAPVDFVCLLSCWNDSTSHDIQFDPYSGDFVLGQNQDVSGGQRIGMVDEGGWWRPWVRLRNAGTWIGCELWPAYRHTLMVAGGPEATAVGSIVACDAQCEIGDHPSSLIITTGTAPVTRRRDWTLTPVSNFTELPPTGIVTPLCYHAAVKLLMDWDYTYKEVFVAMTSTTGQTTQDYAWVRAQSDLSEVGRAVTQVNFTGSNKLVTTPEIDPPIDMKRHKAGDIVDYRVRITDTQIDLWMHGRAEEHINEVYALEAFGSPMEMIRFARGNNSSTTSADIIIVALRIVPESQTDEEILAWENFGTISGPSPEALAVLNRMTSLSATETTAIGKFVDSQVASGNWAKIDEFYCFALNSVDWLTGWKSHSALVTGVVNNTQWGAEWVDTASHIDTQVVPENQPNYTDDSGSMGVYIHNFGYIGTGNYHPCWMYQAQPTYSYLGVRHEGNDVHRLRFAFNSGTDGTVEPFFQEDIGHSLFSVASVPGTAQGYRNATALGNSFVATDGMFQLGYPHFIGRNSNGGSAGESSRADTTITAWYTGAGDLDTENLYDNLIEMLFDLGVYDPEIKTVLSRFSALTRSETGAVIRFVNSQLASGNWAKIDEFYCFALNSTDWLTGWKSNKATLVGTVNPSPEGASFLGTRSYINTQMDMSQQVNYQIDDCLIGTFTDKLNYTSTGNHYFFGADTAAVTSNDIYVRQQGIDQDQYSWRLNSGVTQTFDGNQAMQSRVDHAFTVIYRTGGLSRLSLNGADVGPTYDSYGVIPSGIKLHINHENTDDTSGGNTREGTITSFVAGAGSIDITDFYDNLMLLHFELGMYTEARKTLGRLRHSMTGAEQAAIIRFINSQVASGNWAMIDEFFCFAMTNENNARESWTSNIQINRVNGPNYVTGGYDYDTSSTYNSSSVRLGSETEHYTNDNGFIGCYIYAHVEDTDLSTFFMGVEHSGLATRILHHGNDSNTIEVSVNSDTAILNTGFDYYDIAGHAYYAVARDGVQEFWRDGIKQPVTGTVTASGIPDGYDLYMGTTNNAGTSRTTRRHTGTAYWIGGGAGFDVLDWNNNLMVLLSELGVA